MEISRGYSQDVRDRVVDAALKNGLSARAAAAQFAHIAPSQCAISQWLPQQRRDLALSESARLLWVSARSQRVGDASATCGEDHRSRTTESLFR